MSKVRLQLQVDERYKTDLEWITKENDDATITESFRKAVDFYKELVKRKWRDGTTHFEIHNEDGTSEKFFKPRA